MWQDLRQAVRVLAKNPGFTAIAVCSLAIGIGANSAIFSAADGMVLRPLAVKKPDQVVSVTPVSAEVFGANSAMSYPDYRDLRDRTRSFDGVVGFNEASFGYSVDPRAVPVRKFGNYVTGNFFQVLGVEPNIGRGFRSEEDQVAGRDAVVVLSHDLWVSDFGADPGAIGQKVRLNGVEFTVVGVAPERFKGADHMIRPALYVPVAIWPRLNAGNDANAFLKQRDAHWLTVKGRLKAGVSQRQAQADTDAIAAELRRSYPTTDRELRLKVESELQMRVEQDPPDTGLMEMLMGLAACVLLVACANVAGLLLSRSQARAREIAVRLAIGAARWQLIRQLLVENALLALLGGGLGVLVGYVGIEFFRQLPKPSDLPIAFDFQLDNRVLAFTLLVSLVSTFVFGLAPAWRSSRADVNSALRARDAEDGGKRGSWGRNALVSAQVALSVVLLIASAVLLKDLGRLLKQGPGYRTEQLYLTTVDTSLLHYTNDQRAQFFKKLVDEARVAPGVRSAALASAVPMSMTTGMAEFVPEGYQLPNGKTSLSSFDAIVGDGYFETLGIAVRGRTFGTTDRANTTPVAIVNQHFAEHYWPGQDAIGKRIHLANAAGTLVQVVGVARTTKYLWIAEPAMDFVYLPFTQHPRSEMTLVTESRAQDATVIAPVVREVVHRLDANMPLFDTRPMHELYTQRAVKVSNMIIEAVTAMGLLALMLAMIGLYGLVAYSVSRRTREIGIRMAIGADQPKVLRMVIGQGFGLGLAGVVVGSVLGVMACRLLTAALMGAAGGADPWLFVVISLGLLAITMLAAYAPARRASRIDPMMALRDE